MLICEELVLRARLDLDARRIRAAALQLTVALDAGVSPETLRKIESGRVATPAFPTIAAIAEVLGLSLDAVWAEISEADVATDGVGRDPERIAS